MTVSPIDLHARTTPAAAIQFGRLLIDYNLYWYEEPCWPESIDGLQEVARALPFPIAIRRGFIASGTSRTRSTCSSPCSRFAPRTST